MRLVSYRAIAVVSALALTLAFALWLEGEVTWPQIFAQEVWQTLAHCPPQHLCPIM